jgi:deoxyribodipyrimidine photo-lyase
MNIFLFHRDLRLHDNTTLIHTLKENKSIVPVFIFPPEQINPNKNKYFSSNSVQFMCESLHNLSDSISNYKGEIYFFEGDNIKVLDEIHKNNVINSISYNIDYTPYSKHRDNIIKEWANKNNIIIYEKEDYAMYNILDGITKSKTTGNTYLVFTPFKKFCLKNLTVSKPDKFHNFKFDVIPKLKKNTFNINEKEIDKFYTTNILINVSGGRENGLKILKNINKFDHYNTQRDCLTYKTTFLAAHNHFGTVSIREVFYAIHDKLGKNNNLISELHWRDFYYNIVYYNPKVLEGMVGKENLAFKEKYDNIKWSYDTKMFKAWCEGKTGVPIIDAAMTQLNTTGFMHNRARMIVASFLCKDLHIDWRWGEKYFATKLVDYDPIANNQGWMWTTGCGTDASIWFRIFNPFTQAKKFDPKCHYIKQWLSVLKDVPDKDIHNWFNTYEQYKETKYYEPIIEHDKERLRTLEIYKKALK